LVKNITQQSLDVRRLVGYMPEEDCLPPDLSAIQKDPPEDRD
jgi:ABC-type multidrug transport system ATPase subunit